MITPEIISYIKAERAKNTPESTIKSNLLGNGWSQRDIDEAIPPSTYTASGVPMAPLSVAGLKKYRRKRKWIIFLIWLAIDILFLIRNFLPARNFIGTGALYWIASLVVVYGVAYLAARGSVPFDKKWKSAIDLIVRIILAGFIIIMLSLGALFASCLFSGGGF